MARVVCALFATLGLIGCGTAAFDLTYYWQSVSGHWQVLARARPVDELIADQGIEPRLREQLRSARALRQFAVESLDLPDNRSYTHFADLGRPFVVWNVVAAPEFSLEPYRWCFPVAGCISYRGYYAQADAEREAELLAAKGLDIQVQGIAAYSTLGWFDDPLLSTFIAYPPVELGRLIFHELAHQIVYLKGDTAFNESFATAVEQIGVNRWLDLHGTAEQRQAWLGWQRRRDDFLALLERSRTQLTSLYQDTGDRASMRTAKAAIFEGLRRDYRALRDGAWGGYAGYDRWFARPLGNAHLAAVAAYTEWVPAFLQLYQRLGDDCPRFYEEVRRIARLEPTARRAALAKLDPEAVRL